MKFSVFYFRFHEPDVAARDFHYGQGREYVALDYGVRERTIFFVCVTLTHVCFPFDTKLSITGIVLKLLSKSLRKIVFYSKVV